MDTSGLSVLPALTATNLAAAPPAPAFDSDTRSKATRPQEHAEPVDPTQLPAPIKGLGIAPLDLFQVGDNDDIPLPPDPPRDPIAMVAPLEFAQDPAVGEDDGEARPPETATPEAEAPQEPAPELARAVQALDDGSRAPSVDIRR